MPLSFKSSKESVANSVSVRSDIAAPTAELASENEQEYTLCDDGRYLVYTKYRDDNISTIDESKSISVHPSQINITQEENSQYIPFRLKRYWDGMDLMEMFIQFHYSNKNGEEDFANPINVKYNDEYILIGWLVNGNVTALDGDVTFEIIAEGSNEHEDNYRWKTKPNGKLNILKSLSGNGIIEPSDDWHTSFVRTMQVMISEAKKYADQAKESADEVDVDNIKTNVEKSVIDKVSDDYYTKAEIDSSVKELQNSISEINSLNNLAASYDRVTGKLTLTDTAHENVELASITINSLSNLVVKYEVANGKGTLSFLNGETEITSVEIGNVNPSAEWTAALRSSITSEIETAVEKIKKEVKTVSTKADVLEKTVTDINASVETIKSDLSTAKSDISSIGIRVTEAENTIGVVKSDLDSHTTEIQGLNNGLADLEEKVANIGTVKSNEYDVDYIDNTFTFYENDEIKKQFTITGGGGGTVDTSTLTIIRITAQDAIILSGNQAFIKYRFTSVDSAGDETGNGIATWTIGSTVVASSTAVQGENTFDITQYLKTGENRIKISITDSYGTIGTKTWTLTVVEFKLESIFDDKLFYSGDVTFRYTPYGNISKDIHFILDGKEISGTNTSISGRQMTQTIPAQSHGSHLLEVYMTATINTQEITSESVYKDIIWVDAENKTPIIGCSIFHFAAQQYNTTAIPYVVYDPEHNPATIALSVNGSPISTLSVDRTEQIWSYKSADIGKQTLAIKCGDVTKTINAEIEELGIDIKPVTTNLAFDFNPSGKHNGSDDWLKINDDLSISVSDNFDTSNGGYQIDVDGDTYFCVKAGTTATIPYCLFADDAKKTGKNFKFVYKATNVKDYDAQVLSCFSNGIGFQAFAQKAELTSEQNSVSVSYCEDNYMELEFNTLPDAEYREMVMWLDSIPTRVKIYSESDSFTQTIPVGITIGSDNCDVWIYRMKSYTMNLTDDEILDNFIADAKNADEMINRYIRNDILDSSGSLDPDLLAEKCPALRVIKIDTPRFTTGKKDKVTTTSIQHIYKAGRESIDNWLTSLAILSGQGTSSEYYGESARNLDLNCVGGFNFADGTKSDKYGMTEMSVPVNYFNIKVNVASSEGINNSYVANEANRYNPYLRPARINNPKVRDTMEFHPCVVFIRETDIENSVEFHDGQWHFYACGNIGNSKKNAEAMGMDPENHKEFIVELLNNVDPQCRFLSDDLSNEGWDGDTSFEMRYKNSNCTPEELQAGKAAWHTLLTWVVNATPDTFVAEFEDHFIKDSVLFYYLFTERHMLVDNRAKNSFWHTEDLVHWDICFDYDNDTAMGNDNEGGLTLTYGYEDTDTIGTKSVFNAADSKLWCYVRDYMYDDLAAMFIKLESRLAWSANRILSEMEAEQALFPERLRIMDMRRKYFRPYEDNGTTSYLEMMHGDKKHQRRQFQKYQEKYIASKYIGAASTSDVITIRGYTPVNWSGVKPDGTFHIIPYADTYIVARFGSNVIKRRGKRGQTYEIKSPIAALNDTEIYVYNASIIQSIGDIAPFYPGYTDFNQGIKLTDLTVGSGTEGYSNTNLHDFGIGRNVLLERLNLQNVPNLRKTISLANCFNLEEFLADGSGITGVIFATGGKIRTAHLPAISSMTAKSLNHLTDLTFENYDNITTLSIDNCPVIDEQDLLSKAINLTRLRLTGINWNLNDTVLLDRLAKMAGIDENGYNTVTSVLAGRVHVPIMREQKLAHYNTIWPDLEVAYDTMITQYRLTFQNADTNHTVLDIQYVDKGTDGVDPVTRTDNPIPKPNLESTVSTDYTYAGWDDTFTGIFADRVITAVYTETTREYTARFVSKGIVLQEKKGPYGTTVYYDGDTPTYTAEEAAYKYNLFKGWDKSGYIDGDKVINAVYDTCEYTEGYFDGKELADMSEVEIYTMMKMGLESTLLTVKDSLDFKIGVDYSYNDIEEHEVIASDVKFDGTNYLDTKLAIMNKDRDFTVAIDYEFAGGNTSGATLAQCFQSDGSNGFRLWYSTEPRLSWGTDSLRPSGATSREIIVLRHKAGSNTLMVYNSNLSAYDVLSSTLTAIRIPEITSTLVFGCSKADDGIYENYAKGTVHWCKVWYADLGDQQCKDISSMIHATLPMELAKFRGYYLADTASKRANLTFLASNLLGVSRQYSNKSTNTGGWADATLNTWINTRLYKAISPLWKALIKPVKVYSSVGNKSNDISVSNCYFYVPSLYEVDATASQEPYINETNATIPYLTGDESRKRAKVSTPDVYETYWTRSPNATVTNWIYTVSDQGASYGFSYPSYDGGILLMFSIGI